MIGVYGELTRKVAYCMYSFEIVNYNT